MSEKIVCQAGLQRAASPLTGLQGCPLLLSLSSCAACGGTQKEKKEFLRGHPAPQQKALPSALPILELLTQKFGMTHVCMAGTALIEASYTCRGYSASTGIKLARNACI
jgi:hypothetical protein